MDDLHSQNSTLNIDNFFTLPILERKSSAQATLDDDIKVTLQKLLEKSKLYQVESHKLE